MPLETIIDYPCRVKRELGHGDLRAGTPVLLELLSVQRRVEQVRATTRPDYLSVDLEVKVIRAGAEETTTLGKLEVEMSALDPHVPVVEATDPFGNLFQRIVAPRGFFSIRCACRVETADFIDVAPWAGLVPRRGVRLVGLRGEESPWYGTAYLGSRMALGHVPFATMAALVRGDTGRTLGDHMAALGFLGQDGAVLSRAKTRLFQVPTSSLSGMACSGMTIDTTV